MNATLRSYSGYFGRDPDAAWEMPAQGQPVTLATFPEVTGGFLRKMFSTAPHYRIYITAGVSTATPHALEFVGCRAGHGSQTLSEQALRESELLLMCKVIEFAASSPETIGPGDTVDFGEVLPHCAGISAVLLLPVLPDLRERELLRRAKPAQMLLSVMPLYAAELGMKKAEGLEYLMDRFEEAGIEPLLDLERKPLAA